MNSIRIFIITVIVFTGCLETNVTFGSATYWEALPSPDQASVTAMGQRDGSILLAGTGAGLFTSTDQGDSWHLRSPVDWRISTALATIKGTILVGAYRHGVKRSTDGGLTWTSVGFDRNVYVDSLIQDHTGRIFASVAHSVSDEPTGIFRSDDDGATWVQAGLEGEHAYSVSSPLPGHLYAGTERGMFRSIDGGETWAAVESLSFSAPLSGVVALGSMLFAGFAEPRYRAPGNGTFSSTDGGETWGPMKGMPPETSVHALVVVGNTLFAASGDLLGRGGKGIYQSTDHRTWKQEGLKDQWLKTLIATPDGALFAGTSESGILASIPGEMGWSSKSNGLRNWDPTALILDPTGRIYGLTLRSLFMYDEPDGTWTSHELPEGTAAPTPFNFARLSDGTLILPGLKGVLYSRDSSEAWFWSGIPGAEGHTFHLYVGSDDHLYATFLGEGSFVTSNAGETWTRVGVPEDTRGVFISPAGTLFAFGAGVFRSTAEGAWEQVSPNLQMTFAIEACGTALYFGNSTQGIFSSQDDGQTWDPITEELRLATQQSGYISVHSLLCLPDGGLLGATFSNGVIQRTKGGTWKDVTAGLPSRSAGDLALGPDGQVYVGTTSGVYRSTAWNITVE